MRPALRLAQSLYERSTVDSLLARRIADLQRRRFPSRLIETLDNTTDTVKSQISSATRSLDDLSLILLVSVYV